VGFVVDKVALGQVFSEYFGFLYEVSFRQNAAYLSIIQGWFSKPIMVNVPSELSLNPANENKNYKKYTAGYLTACCLLEETGLSSEVL
jgi:hypothetical protein